MKYIPAYWLSYIIFSGRYRYRTVPREGNIVWESWPNPTLVPTPSNRGWGRNSRGFCGSSNSSRSPRSERRERRHPYNLLERERARTPSSHSGPHPSKVTLPRLFVPFYLPAPLRHHHQSRACLPAWNASQSIVPTILLHKLITLED